MSYPKRVIYLAGPITGLTHDEARYGWRLMFSQLLDDMDMHHICCASPMRGKEFLKDLGVLSSGHDYPDNALSTAAGITTRDRNDVFHADLMVACFLESNNKPSLGTAVEYGWADAFGTPVITIGPRDDLNVRHLMLDRLTGWHVDNLAEAADIAALILTPSL